MWERLRLLPAFDDLNPVGGLAFGRAGWVGVDGSLTGVIFSFSLLAGALAWVVRKKNRTRECWCVASEIFSSLRVVVTMSNPLNSIHLSSLDRAHPCTFVPSPTSACND